MRECIKLERVESVQAVVINTTAKHYRKYHVDMCGVEGKRRLCDLNVTSLRPPLATRHIRCVLLVNSPNKLNLLSWLLIYLCNKESALHEILYLFKYLSLILNT